MRFTILHLLMPMPSIIRNHVGAIPCMGWIGLELLYLRYRKILPAHKCIGTGRALLRVRAGSDCYAGPLTW